MDNNLPLKNVVAYVEIRLDKVDISVDIARELIALGASVEQSIKKNVTHVVFREGTLTTWLSAYDKGLHIVSVSWVKFCKDHKVHAPENLFRPEVPEKTVRCKFIQALSPESSRKRSSVGKPRLPYTLACDRFHSPLTSSAIISPSFPTIKRFVTPPSMRIFRERMERRKSTPGVCPFSLDLSDSDNDEIMSKTTPMKTCSVPTDAAASNSNNKTTLHPVVGSSENSALLSPTSEANNSASNSSSIESMKQRLENTIDKHEYLTKAKKERIHQRTRSLKPYSRPSRVITRSVSKASELRTHMKLKG